MKRFLLGALVAAASFAAHAQTTSNIGCAGNVVTLQLSYATGADASRPGLFWLALINPNGSAAAYLDIGGKWQSYQGGLLPPTGRYDAGLPPVISLNVALPGNTTNTYGMEGWIVAVGKGVLTAEQQQLVTQRRQALDSVKAQRVAAGTWDPAFDDDNQMKWGLVQGDMLSNKKYVAAQSVPVLDCGYVAGGGGGR